MVVTDTKEAPSPFVPLSNLSKIRVFDVVFDSVVVDILSNDYLATNRPTPHPAEMSLCKTLGTYGSEVVQL